MNTNEDAGDGHGWTSLDYSQRMKMEEKSRDDKKRGEEGMISWITFGNPEDMTFPILCPCCCNM